MKLNSFLLSTLLLYTLVFFLETLADLLNLNYLTEKVPDEFQGIYDPEKYRTSIQYQKENLWFQVIHNTVSFGLILFVILVGGLNWIDQWGRSFGFGTIGSGSLFAVTLLALHLLVNLPFSIYRTFGIEQRYGFNRMSPATFVSDLIKGSLLTLSLGGLVFMGVVLFFEKWGSEAWLYAWVGTTLFQLLLVYLAPAVILPLFNRFSPLPESELKRSIETFAKSQNFKLNGIFTMDSSKRSTKSNAFFAGFGSLRRLVLFDTLISQHTVEELIAVLAHEIGHFKRKHILKSIGLSVGSSGILFYGVSFLLNNPELFAAFRMKQISVYASLVLAGFLYSPILRLLSLLTHFISRHHEFEADHYSKISTGKPEMLISALKKMSMDHLAHLTPHPLKVALDYSHPPILKRIQALRTQAHSRAAV